MLTKIGKAYSALEQEFERESSAGEIAKQIEMSNLEVVDTQKIAGRHLSMDIPFRKGESNSLLEVIENKHQPPPDADLIGESLKVEIEQALVTLTGRETEIVRCILVWASANGSLTPAGSLPKQIADKGIFILQRHDGVWKIECVIRNSNILKD